MKKNKKIIDLSQIKTSQIEEELKGKITGLSINNYLEIRFIP